MVLPGFAITEALRNFHCPTSHKPPGLPRRFFSASLVEVPQPAPALISRSLWARLAAGCPLCRSKQGSRRSSKYLLSEHRQEIPNHPFPVECPRKWGVDSYSGCWTVFESFIYYMAPSLASGNLPKKGARKGSSCDCSSVAGCARGGGGDLRGLCWGPIRLIYECPFRFVSL